MKQQLTHFGLAICALLGGMSGNAHAAAGAAVPEFLASHDPASAVVKVQLVDDDVLAGQTGKGVGGMMISGFVLNVLSQWQLPNGVTALAQGTFGAVTNALGQVTSTVSTLASVSGGGPGSNGVSVALQTPAGLATQTITPGNGQIAQLLQIAGNNQQVANALQLHFSFADAANVGRDDPATRRTYKHCKTGDRETRAATRHQQKKQQQYRYGRAPPDVEPRPATTGGTQPEHRGKTK
ncbi:MAG: Fap system putative outer membrane protein [uncultured Paraburkholderia sp.]|nr:MAG: Fap system putative outer membrane protein [uncultured Paraburkholderia sp.]CAH2939067.1 MAG: Fap system putative outer membrane protein [uncultured Paraburkholderia sp.]